MVSAVGSMSIAVSLSVLVAHRTPSFSSNVNSRAWLPRFSSSYSPPKNGMNSDTATYGTSPPSMK